MNLSVLPTFDPSFSSCSLTLTYQWSITDSGNVFNGIALDLDSTSSPTTLTIGDLSGSVTAGTYDLELKVVDAANPLITFSGSIKLISVTVQAVVADPCTTYTLTNL